MKKTKKINQEHYRLVAKHSFVALAFLIFAFVHVLVFNVIMGESFSVLRASTNVGLIQEIAPIDPVKDDENVVQTADENSNDDGNNIKYDRSEFRLVSAIDKEKENAGTAKYIAKSAIITFRGKSIYPNADVLLGIHSHEIRATAKSDGQGNWSWTNFGQPLEKGDHFIEAYSISPFDFSGKRDVYSEKYSFIVDPISMDAPDVILLDRSQYVESTDSGNLEKKLMTGKVSDIYIFHSMLLKQKEYSPGDPMLLQMIFNPFEKNSDALADLRYEIFYYGDREMDARLVSTLADSNVKIGEGGSFLKKISLKQEIMAGGYFVKVTARINGMDYIQINKFDVNPKMMVQIGDIRMSQESLGKVITWNTLAILAVFIIVAIVVIIEFRRLMIYGSIDSSFLKKKGFFSR